MCFVLGKNLLNPSKLSIDRENFEIKLGGDFVDFKTFCEYLAKYGVGRPQSLISESSGNESFNQGENTRFALEGSVIEKEFFSETISTSNIVNVSQEVSPESSVTCNVSFHDLRSFIPVLEGKAEDAFNFINACEEAIKLAKGQMNDILFKYICMQLRGNAQTIILNEEFGSWSALKAKLIHVYAEPHSILQLQRELFSFKQNGNETVVQWQWQWLLSLHRRILTAGADQFSIGENLFIQEQVRTVFINDLKEVVTMYVMTQKPKSL
ncbi:unnamed protein product [Hermetia illucens]|uniref:Uncharacterized protein n=1 Tax=Hermetia illucens TaxID=343691 RepID=A0A7R8UIW0_HERIL|nr:unnamed protein product [Hermetia illucens]